MHGHCVHLGCVCVSKGKATLRPCMLSLPSAGKGKHREIQICLSLARLNEELLGGKWCGSLYSKYVKSVAGQFMLPVKSAAAEISCLGAVPSWAEGSRNSSFCPNNRPGTDWSQAGPTCLGNLLTHPALVCLLLRATHLSKSSLPPRGP